ncbi:MAG: hypothetical protein DMG89_03510 [Acidobacteria bacterium]|nr:MAG: hypothetical protein DMG89_03510 [Acidobacteriota bacterium]
MLSALRVSRAFSLCVVAFFSLGTFAQNTILVPGDQPTIQGGIDAANNGDTVLVAPSTYYENINFKGKAITVTSSAGAAQTIIDGGQKASVVTFNSFEGTNSVISGFTLQNGSDVSSTTSLGGGIFIDYASPKILNNIIQNNASSFGGAGILVYFSSPVVQGNIIRNNYSPGYSGVIGGGIYVLGGGAAQIIGNLIASNSTAPSGSGGGIGLNGAGTPVIKNNTISGNVTGRASEGGGIWINASAAMIIQNLIYNNSADQAGGIDIFSGDTGLLIVSNTIVNNSVASSSPLGSAIYVQNGVAQVVGNLLIGPLQQSASYSAVYCENTNQPFPFFSNDAFTPSSGAGFSGACSGQGGQNGNISADPLFVNAASDFHLQPTSPAIDVGTNTAPNLPQTDFAGNPRVLDGNNDCVSTVDMGSYELVRSANLSFSTSTLNFANQALNTSSTPRPVTLSNTGNTCFQFSNLGITGDFSQANTCGAAGVRGGASCIFNVTFTPAALGTRLGALTVNGSDGITSASPSVSLSGVGVDFSISANPASATVKHGQSVKFSVTVNPLGGSFTSAVGLSCSGLPSGASCSFSPSSVTPGASGATSVMTVSTLGKTPRGNYNVLIVGNSGGDSHSTTVLLSVN